MAFWSGWFRPKEQKYDSLDLFRDIYGGSATRSGVTVNWQTALDVADVLACLRVRAEGFAQVPWKVYQGDNRTIATEHPLYDVINLVPNRWQTSYEFRETISYHRDLMGNAYVFVGRVGRERVIRELVPLEPQFVTVEKSAEGVLSYRYAPTGGQAVIFPAESIWHIKGASWNGYAGMDAIKLMREAVSLAVAAESAHAEMHKSNARVSGVYAVDGPLSAEKYDFLAKWLDRYAMGGDRAGKPMILDLGAKFMQTQMSGVDAQHLETRQFQTSQIARSFRVMPIMIGAGDKTATYASSEQMFIAHVVHTLLPIYTALEQSAAKNLLSEEDRKGGFYTKFTPNALMRGSSADRAQYYIAALGNTQQPGWMLKNEVRGLEELPPVDGGDEFPPLITQMPAETPTDNVDASADAMKMMAQASMIHAEAAKTAAGKPPVSVTLPEVKIDTLRLDPSSIPAPNVYVDPPIVNIEAPPEKKAKKTRTRVLKHDDKGRIAEFEQVEVD